MRRHLPDLQRGIRQCDATPRRRFEGDAGDQPLRKIGWQARAKHNHTRIDQRNDRRHRKGHGRLHCIQPRIDLRPRRIVVLQHGVQVRQRVAIGDQRLAQAFQGRPRHAGDGRDAPQFAHIAVRAAAHVAGRNHAGSKAVGDRQIDQVRRLAANAVHGFGQGGAMGVVVHPDR
ncbi:hypothetical protein CKU38_00086 [Xanthomonas citri pv. fuscans]|nr:hypothetical protein CKU38_00086 [Xanthomonas citri pv. fuscans]